MTEPEALLLLCMSLICLAIGLARKWVEYEASKWPITTEEA